MTDQSATLPSFHSIRAFAAAGVRPVVATATGLVILAGLALALPFRITPQTLALMEVVAICLGLFAGILALVRHRACDEGTFLFIGAGFLGSAILDGFHLVAASDGLSPFFPSAVSTLTPWCWLASRLWLSICLYLSWLVWKYPGRGKSFSDNRVYTLMALMLLGCGLLFVLVPMPQAYIGHRFLHRPAELIPAAFFALALVGYVKQDAWRENALERWLVCSLMVAILAQWLVMSWSTQPLDGPFSLAYLLKIVSAAMVLGGLIAGVSQSHADVDQLTRLQLQSDAELDRLSQDLQVVLRSVSHDLKAPVRHITGFCGFILEDAKDRLTESETEDLKRILEAASNMTNLIDRLVGYARLDTSSLNCTDLSLSDLVESVVVHLPRDQQHRVTCVEMTDIRADRKRMMLVMQNLVDNGLRYTRDPAGKVVVSSESSPEGTVVSVCDCGIGVEKRQASRIFEPGVRGVRDSEFPGTGYGLAICTRIINAHGGRIWVEANPEQGSTFRFVIPSIE